MFLLALVEVPAHPPAAPAPGPPPSDTPHLACTSPARVHLISRTGDVNSCGSARVCCGGSGAPGNLGSAARGPPTQTCGDRGA